LTIIRLTQLFDVSSAQSALPSVIINKLKVGSSPLITCDPQIQRDYLSVVDFIDFIKRVIEKPIEGIFNVGSGSPIKIIDLFKTSFNCCSKQFDPNKHIVEDFEPSFSQYLDIEKAKKYYGYSPMNTIEHWIKKLTSN
jgi:nucleoside-diphosphate-sugar epimerase